MLITETMQWASRVYIDSEEVRKLIARPSEPRRIWNMDPEIDAAILQRWNSKIRDVQVALKGVEWTTIEVFRIGTYTKCPPTLLIGARDRTEPQWESALEKVRDVVGDFLVVETEQTDPAIWRRQPRMVAGIAT